MKSSLKFMIPVAISAALVVLMAFSRLPFPDNKTPELLAKANGFNLQFPQEKVYLHLDRSSYWASEDIWFKAYLKDSPIPECNLYLELLSASGKVIQKKMYWSAGGVTYGDFHLSDTLHSGVYQVRAYTNWMRNFDEQWFFRKDLVILNPAEKLVPEELNRLKENKVDFQFFPEGGTFLLGTKNKIAFKVVDQKGKGLDAEGEIVDDLGKVVAVLKSNFKGLGSFTLEPKENRRYTAKVKVAGDIEMNVELPVAQDDGVSLAVNSENAEQLLLQVARKTKSSTENLPAEYVLVGQTQGNIIYRKSIAMDKNISQLVISTKDLPTGIIQFTLFDPKALPLCERLVFINQHDFIPLEIKTGKSDYHTREQVQMGVNAIDKMGNPYFANLSMSVFNAENQLKGEIYPNNILTHFLLCTELKGLVEEPAYYFKDDSLSTLRALDNLMLTHGYRHFEWKEILAAQFPEIDYPAEKCIELRGSVKSILRGRPVANSSVTLISVKTRLVIKEQKSDSLGKFLFSDLYFNDTVRFSLQSVNAKGKRNTEIELDDRATISPKATYLPSTYQYVEEKPVNTTSWISEQTSEQANRKWHLTDNILLGDVNIKAERTKKDDGHLRIYQTPDFVFDVAKMDDVMSNIFEMMDGRVPGVRMEDNAFYIRGNRSSALLLLDGVPVNTDLIMSMSPRSFDKVEILKYAPMLGSRGNNGAIFFYLKRGYQQETITPDALGMKSATVIGYSVIRHFYSPNYDTPLPQDPKEDLRSTIYWDPILRTDSLGRASVSFYNSDQTGEVQVVVEGVTVDGKLCRGTAKYNVVPK